MDRQNYFFVGRSFLYILIIVPLTTFSSFFSADLGSAAISKVFIIMVFLSAIQVSAVFLKVGSWAFFAFLLSDVLLSFWLVRGTGGSASPFTVLFPLLSLSGAVILEGYLKPILISLAALVVMALSVGFGASIFGNAVAILATGGLGFYLSQALTSSGLALERSEGARRRLENLQKAILTSIPSGLVSVDSEGRIIQVNKVATKILGLSEQDLLGKSLANLVPELSGEVSRLSTLLPQIQSEAQGDRKAVDYKAPDGSFLKLGYSIARLADAKDNNFLGTLVVFQDLTQISKLEENLRTSEKLAAVGKLAAGIAHEIRNPLASISGSAQLLQNLAGSLQEEDQRLLAIIQRESQRLDSLISEFLEYVRPQKMKLESVSLDTVCGKVVESLDVSPKWKSLGCTVVVSGDNNVQVQGDVNKLTQVLMNLIYNAGQAGASQVKLYMVNGKNPTLSVVDNGQGISAQNLERLFEPFFTTKEGGTGLGLAISYRILEAMGARIRVKSPVEAQGAHSKPGTEFTIDFRGV